MAILTALAPNRTSFIAPKTFRGTVTVRKSASNMTSREIQDYRLAVYRTAAISAQNQADNRGFQWVAGIHGVPQGLCKHGVPAFVLWHRPYVQLYEQILQDAVPGTFVPYWNWTVDRTIPQIFLDATWTNPDTGQVEANPLIGQPMNGGAVTTRQPGAPDDLIPDGVLVSQALLATDYDAFAPDLENPHNDVHGWVGGDMGFISNAAYDPLFWSHHSFVEFLFCKWQDAHTAAPQPSDVSSSDLVPFGVTVDQIWNYSDLGYVYESGTATRLTLEPTAAAGSEGGSRGLESGAIVTTLSLQDIDPEFSRAEVRLNGLTLPEKTFELRVFANEPAASAASPTEENPHYLGSQHFFGHGGCFGAPGHCDPVQRDIFDLRPRHHYAPVTIRLNVTKRLRELLKQKGLRDVPLKLITVDPDGKEIRQPGLTFEGLTIVIR